MSSTNLNISEIYSFYQQSNSLKITGYKFNIPKWKVQDLLKSNGYDLNKQIRYKSNYDFFKQETEKSFYWAGFIAADGCILDKKSSSKILSIGLASKDKNHLEKFKNDLESENPILDYTIDLINDKRYPTYYKKRFKYKSEIKITSDTIAEDLKKFNIVSRKSKIYSFPEWIKNHPLLNHYMRGYFCGDGCISVKTNKRISAKNQPYFSVVGTEQFIKTYHEILCLKLGLDKNKSGNFQIRKGLFVVTFGGSFLVDKILNFLYKDSVTYLDRKKKRADHVFEHVKNKKIKIKERKDKREIEFAEKLNKIKLRIEKYEVFTDENVLKQYTLFKSLYKLRFIFGCRSSKIEQSLLRSGVKFKKKIGCPLKEISINKEDFLNICQNSSSLEDIASKIGYGRFIVNRLLKEYNIPFEKNTTTKYDRKYFSPENRSPEQFYYAGALLGRSSIDEKSYSIKITTQQKQDLEKINFFIKNKSKIFYLKKYKSFCTEIYSKVIIQDLQSNFGIGKNKLLEYEFPEHLLQDEYLKYFILGKLRAKGSIKENWIELTGSVNFLTQLKIFFEKECSFSAANEIRKRKDKNCNRLTYTGKVANKIFHYLNEVEKELNLKFLF